TSLRAAEQRNEAADGRAPRSGRDTSAGSTWQSASDPWQEWTPGTATMTGQRRFSGLGQVPAEPTASGASDGVRVAGGPVSSAALGLTPPAMTAVGAARLLDQAIPVAPANGRGGNASGAKLASAAEPRLPAPGGGGGPLGPEAGELSFTD